MLPGEACSQVTQHLKSAYDDALQGILLYGSQATGHAKETSDIDLAILLDPAKPGTQPPSYLWEAAQELACLLGKDVDLIDLRQVNTVLQKEAIEHGAWLVKFDEFACNLFETHVLSLYQQLNEERRDIINDLIGRLNDG